MKTTRAKNWTGFCAAVLTAALATTVMFRASADQTATTISPGKNYTGTVIAVDPKDHVLSVKGGFGHKAFNLGDNCSCKVLDKSSATVNDLRPGAKVTVSYQDAHGVLIADRVEQQPMQYEGMVKTIDPDKHVLTLRRSSFDKQLLIADGCKIMLRDGKSGTLADIRVGNHVTVTYETPDNQPTVREIAQTSIAFTGKLTAVDLEDKTVKAKSGFDSKKFMVGNNCAIVIHGKPDGQLGNLKPNDKLVFSYDEINGVNVVNRIALVETQTGSVADTGEPMAGY